MYDEQSHDDDGRSATTAGKFQVISHQRRNFLRDITNKTANKQNNKQTSTTSTKRPSRGTQTHLNYYLKGNKNWKIKANRDMCRSKKNTRCAGRSARAADLR